MNKIKLLLCIILTLSLFSCRTNDGGETASGQSEGVTDTQAPIEDTVADTDIETTASQTDEAASEPTESETASDEQTENTSDTPIHTHTYSAWQTVKAASCTEKGLRTRKCECGEVEEEDIATTEHTAVVDKGTAASCTESGMSDGKHCSVCGYVIKAQTKLNAKGHTPSDWVVDKEASDELDGSKHRSCTACGIKTDEAVIAVSHGLEYKYSIDYCTVIGLGTCSDTVITVPKTSRGVPVKKIADNAFSGSQTLVEIELPDSIYDIGSSVFKNCSKLKKIKMPSGLEYLGRSAFENCTSLESVSIPGGVAILNDSCFSGCTSLKTIQLGSIRDIGSNAFANCKGLSSLRLPASLGRICAFAFYNCTNLYTIEYMGNDALFRRQVSVETGWNDNAATGIIACLGGGEVIF